MTWGGCSLSHGLLLEGGEHVYVQSSMPALAPGGEEDVSRSIERVRDQISCLFGGSQGSRLGSAKDDVSDSFMSDDSVSVAQTIDLVITKGISIVEAYGARVGGAVKRHSQPVA